MICVYPADCTDFSTNGNGTLAPLSAEVTETLNGEYELTLVHPIDEAGKWQRLVEGCILRAPVPAATTPRVHFSAPGDASGTEIYRIHTDFSEAETRKGNLTTGTLPAARLPFKIQYGQTTVSGVSWTTVALSGFTNTPTIVVSYAGNPSSSGIAVLKTGNESASSFQVCMAGSSGSGSRKVNWIAIGT